MGRIVVGVDDSQGSVAALRWAYDEAGRRGSEIEVIHAWHYPPVGTVVGMGVYGVGHEELEQAGQDVLDRSVEQAGPAPDGTAVRTVLANGNPAAVLVEAAAGAELLVVGSHGRSGLASLLLGSVSQQVANHAPCPVVIVPARE